MLADGVVDVADKPLDITEDTRKNTQKNQEVKLDCTWDVTSSQLSRPRLNQDV